MYTNDPVFLVDVVRLLRRARLFASPWTAARQASLSLTISQSLLKLKSTEAVMLSNHLIHILTVLFNSVTEGNRSWRYHWSWGRMLKKITKSLGNRLTDIANRFVVVKGRRVRETQSGSLGLAEANSCSENGSTTSPIVEHREVAFNILW